MISLHSMRPPYPDLVLPEFKPGAIHDGTTPLHPGWLPVLARVPLFASLSRRHLKRVSALAELRRYKHGAEIVRAGTKGNAFFILLDGSAEVVTPSGHSLGLHEGDYFGELALLDGALRAATVTATTAVAAARIERTAFLQLLKEEPTIWAGLAHGLVAIVRDLQDAQEV
jgi:CRP-like cAMP-binding protein